MVQAGVGCIRVPEIASVWHPLPGAKGNSLACPNDTRSVLNKAIF